MKQTLMLTVLFALSSAAFADDVPQDVKAHADRHRAMAEAHRKAAEYVDAGKSFKECNAQIEMDCKGLASGPHCGLEM